MLAKMKKHWNDMTFDMTIFGKIVFFSLFILVVVCFFIPDFFMFRRGR